MINKEVVPIFLIINSDGKAERTTGDYENFIFKDIYNIIKPD